LNDDQFTVMRAFALAAQFGVSLGVCVAIGVYGGEQLDAHFHSSPILVCIFAGLIVGTVSGIQLIRLSLRRGAS
jgi:F0F1-type ATP synthase assembly protein I